MSASYPLHALRALLTSAAPERGVVVRITGATAQIATRTGLTSALTASSLRPGQRVTLRNGLAYPEAAPTRRYAL